ncbi:acid-sensing ion channel 3 [Eurytemora carolleeae]|uniref:acid-sensing ion channel 3 n=1 Tax=Eurytemora carolleeae TaxID=1294199 RepID=UPI000C762EE1|nr:acid-sensing ion channel 3 [Eurytemora carolleeae]|eukprot:XP_023319625.1 acid-sensing ion channel 3-like [Eurytemora affinis]
MKEECCSRILDTGRYVMEGKCFSSRDKLHYKPKYSDKILGISLGLLLGEDISDKLNPAIAPFWSMATRGAAIGLMDKRDDIPSVAARDLTLLLPDTIARIAISKEVKDTSRMSESFMHRMDCIPVDQEDRMLDEQTVLNDYPGLKHYSVEGCEGYYIQKQLFKLYNCTVLYFPEIPGAQVCGPMQTAELLKIASDANFDYESYNITTASENVCPETCRKTRYSSKISSIKMTESIHEVMRGYTGLKSGDFEAVMVSMYYQGFDYREITFVGKGMKEWLAAVGGNLGLYIGASVFTILEFFILIEEAILGMISRMFKGNERS